MSRRILIIAAHPAFHRSRINKKLMNVLTGLEGVTYHDLYEQYPKFIIDVKREKTLLNNHDIIVFQHPFYWYSGPALLKEWMDMVLEYGYAFGQGDLALKGKYWLSAISVGGTVDDYQTDGPHDYSLIEFLRPYEQTAKVCKMEWLPPFIAYGIQGATDAELTQMSENYRRVLVALRDDVIFPEDLTGLSYINQDLTNLKI